MNRHISHSIIDLEIYNHTKNLNKFFYIKDIKNSLKFYKLDCVGKKKELRERLFSFFENINNYNKNINKIIFLQKKIKRYLEKLKIMKQGPGIIDKSICVNSEDFYSFENIYDIKDEYFFSYKDNNSVYFFDINSFKKLLDSDKKNPYTRNDIDYNTINSFNKRWDYLVENKLIENNEENILYTKNQLLNHKIIEIFQKLDTLNIYAGGLNINWFTDLSLPQLKMYYKSLEDIWNYRAELSYNQKLEIVPQNNMFPKSVNEIFNIYDKYTLQNIVLDEINKLVSSSPNNNSKITGGYYVLTALVEISNECAQCMPWLIQLN